MNIQLPPSLAAFIDAEVSGGHFKDRNAVIVYALRMMQVERADSLAELNSGLADIKAGRVQPLDEAIADIRNAIR